VSAKHSLTASETLEVESAFRPMDAPALEPRSCGRRGCRRNELCLDCRRPLLALFGCFRAPTRAPESGVLPVSRVRDDWRGRTERRRELAGREFGALRVLAFAGHAKSCRNALWTAECRTSHGGCGEVVTVRGSDLHGREHCGCRTGRRLVTHDGLTLPLTAWERELHRRGLQVSWRTLKTRLRAGWTEQEALSTPVLKAG
jgi:hypothetical protein